MKPLAASTLLGLPWPLTARQVEIMTLWVKHGTQKAVARHLNLSDNTVSNTIGMVRRKLRAATQIHALLEFDRATRQPTRKRMGLHQRMNQDMKTHSATGNGSKQQSKKLITAQVKPGERARDDRQRQASADLASVWGKRVD